MNTELSVKLTSYFENKYKKEPKSKQTP